MNRELLNRLGREAHHGTRQADTRVIDAIRHVLGAERPAAVDAQSASRTGSDAHENAVLAARVAGSVGLGQSQIQHAMVGHRQVLNLAPAHHAVGGTVLGVDHGRGGLDFHRGGDRPGLQFQGDAGYLRRVDLDVLDHCPLEAFEFGCDAVLHRIEVEHAERPDRGRLGAHLLIGADVLDDDGGVGNRGPGGVHDRARDATPVRLGGKEAGTQQKHTSDTADSHTFLQKQRVCDPRAK